MKMNKSTNLADVSIIYAYAYIAMVYCFFSTLLFWCTDNLIQASIHTIALIIMMINYFMLIKKGIYTKAKKIILITGTLVCLSLFITGGWNATGHLWTFAYIPFAFFLADRKEALFWIFLFFVSCIIALILYITGIINMPYTSGELAMYFIVFMVLLICMYVYQQNVIKQYEGFLSYAPNLLAISIDPFFSIDVNGDITDINQAAQKITGAKPYELIDSYFAGLFTDPAQAENLINRVFTEGIVNNYNLSFSAENGTSKADVIFSATLYDDEKLGVKRIFAIARDITHSI